MLLQATSPDDLLRAPDLAAMSGDWSGLLVLSVLPLQRPFIEGLLRCGAKAVVMPGEGWAERSEQQVGRRGGGGAGGNA